MYKKMKIAVCCVGCMLLFLACREVHSSVDESNDVLPAENTELTAGAGEKTAKNDEKETAFQELFAAYPQTVQISGKTYNLEEAVAQALLTDEENNDFSQAKVEYIRLLRDVVTDNLYYIYISYGNAGASVHSLEDGQLAAGSSTLISGYCEDAGRTYYLDMPAFYVLNDDGSLSRLPEGTMQDGKERLSLEEVRRNLEGWTTSVSLEDGRTMRVSIERDEDGVLVRKRTYSSQEELER